MAGAESLFEFLVRFAPQITVIGLAGVARELYRAHQMANQNSMVLERLEERVSQLEQHH